MFWAAGGRGRGQLAHATYTCRSHSRSPSTSRGGPRAGGHGSNAELLVAYTCCVVAVALLLYGTCRDRSRTCRSRRCCCNCNCYCCRQHVVRDCCRRRPTSQPLRPLSRYLVRPNFAAAPLLLSARCRCRCRYLCRLHSYLRCPVRVDETWSSLLYSFTEFTLPNST